MEGYYRLAPGPGTRPGSEDQDDVVSAPDGRWLVSDRLATALVSSGLTGISLDRSDAGECCWTPAGSLAAHHDVVPQGHTAALVTDRILDLLLEFRVARVVVTDLEGFEVAPHLLAQALVENQRRLLGGLHALRARREPQPIPSPPPSPSPTPVQHRGLAGRLRRFLRRLLWRP